MMFSEFVYSYNAWLYHLPAILQHAGLLSWFVPCYVHGKAAEAVGESCILHAIMWFIFEPIAYFMLASVRSKIREQKGIEVRYSVSRAYSAIF